MKRFINFLMLMLALVIAPMTAQADNHDTVVQDSNGYIPFGRYYWQVNGQPSDGYENHYYAPESEGGERNALTKWAVESGSPKELEAYLHMPAGNTSLTLDVTTSGSTTFQFIVKTATGTQLSSTTQTVNGTKSVSVMSNVNLPASAYYSIRIKVTSGHANISKITRWKITKTSSEQAYLPDYLSSPSVHTNEWKTTDTTAPSGNSYDWAYEEVMIPATSDIVGTYCMSLGVFHGYMGIQVNGTNQHDIIFSMWDNGSTDNDPNLPDYLRSGSLDGNGGVNLSRFGGEGTGAKAFRSGEYWVPGQWVKFLCNARPELVTVETANGPITYTNTLVTAWYKTEGGADNVTNAEAGEDQYDGWHYIATHRLSGGNTFMNGWYSFLENYNWPSGNMKRTAYYRNGALHALNSGKWSHRNYVSCSHTDGGDAAGKRNDYGTGIETVEGEPAFYMTTGGYNNDAFVETQTMTLKENFVPVTQETMDKLLGRVAQAIQHEQERKVTDEFESTRETLAASGFTVVNVNSEATDEGDANKKEAAIDGDENTWWHTRWNAGNGSYNYPYTIDIQLSEEMQAKEIEQIGFSQRSGTNYHGKTFKVYYSNNGTSWTAYSGTYTMEDADKQTINLNSKITGKKYIRLEFTAGYGSYLVLREIYFNTAHDRTAINEQVQDILNKENRFDGYPTADLAALKTAYSSGNWTDENAVRTALLNLAANGTLLKYGTPTAKESLSSFKAYQLYNAKGLGDLIVKTTPAVAADNDVDVTDLNNNWQLLRSEKWNAYYLYNSGAQKYLAFNNGTATLTDKPTPVYVGTRSSGGNFEGFTFQFDPADANSFLTATSASASVRGMNKVAPANTRAVTLGASNTDGAVWQLRDNYGVTPAAVNVNELLEEADEEGAPEGFDGEGYTIRLNNTNLYLSTIEVDDKGKSTYSLSTYPEYFKVVSTGNNTYTLQSATTKKYVGYTGAPTTWDVVNHADNWTIADIEGGVTTIIKSGNQGLGANSNEQAAGHGVFTNKTDTHQWIFTHYEATTPAEEVVLLRPTFVSSSDTRTSGECPSNLVDDNGTSSKWCMGYTNGTTEASIVVQANNTILKGYDLYNGGDTNTQTGRRWKTWTVEGSNDNSNWNTIATVADGKMNTNLEKNSFSTESNTQQYNYYRFTITANEGGNMIQMSDLQLKVVYKGEKISYLVTSDGVPSGVTVKIKDTTITPAESWTAGATYKAIAQLSTSDITAENLGDGYVFEARVDNNNHQVWLYFKQLFAPISNISEKATAISYYIKNAAGYYPYVDNGNIKATQARQTASKYIFVKAATVGQYYIYDISANKYVYASSTGNGGNQTSQSSSKVQLADTQNTASPWTFTYDGCIVPAAGGSAGLNFTGGASCVLNLYATSDSNSKWTITDSSIGSLACAVTMFSEPGKEYIHKLIPESGVTVESITLNGDLASSDLTLKTDRVNKGNNYKYVYGHAPTAEGTYTYDVNLSDGTKATVKLTVSSFLQSPTPGMVWVSWNWFKNTINATNLTQIADGLKSKGLYDVGFKTIVIDDAWGTGDSNATLTYDSTKFPSGMASFVSGINAKGIKVGIYSDAANRTCGNFQPGSLGVETQHVQLFDSWGIDFLKYDFCGGSNAQQSYTTMGDAIAALNASRKGTNPDPFVFNACEWGRNKPWQWGAEAGTSMWRATSDAREDWIGTHDFPGVLGGSDEVRDLWMYAGVNRFNDLDMMTIGLHGKGSPSNHTASHPSDGGTIQGLTDAQARSQMSIWSMLASPLSLSCDVRETPSNPCNSGAGVTPLTASDLATLKNADILTISQDPLGQQAEYMPSLGSNSEDFSTSGCDVYVKDLAGGNKALAIVNRSASATMEAKTISFDNIYLNGSTNYYVKNVWTGKVERHTGSITTDAFKASETKVYIISENELKETSEDTPDEPEDSYITVSTSTGSMNSGWTNKWTHSSAPAITISCSPANINSSNGNLDIRNGSGSNNCNFTITAPEGYHITGYSATVTGSGYTVTPAGGSAITVTNDGVALNVTGLDAQTATFKATGNNSQCVYSNFKVYYKAVEPTEPTDPTYPFIVSPSTSDLHWHYLQVNGNKYVAYDSTTGRFNNSTNAPTGENGLFAFVQVEGGFKIVNKAAGIDKAISEPIGTNIVNETLVGVVDYNQAKTYIYQNNSGHDVFGIASNNQAHLNDIGGKLGYWVSAASGTGDGSTFKFIPAEVLLSDANVKHYYTIRNVNKGDYAHYAGASSELPLNKTLDNNAVFYFTSAGQTDNGFQPVNIHSYNAADNLSMKNWGTWDTSNTAWYIHIAQGTTDVAGDYNICQNKNNTSGSHDCWNHQTTVKGWSANGDKGSAWYIEEVTKKTYTIKIVGGDDNNYTVYNQGTPYRNGDKITGFFFSADNFSQDAVGNQPVKNTVTMEGEYLVFSFYEYDTVTGGTRPTDINDYSLWYDEPATKTGVSDQWMEYALPMGNGQLGATIVGGVMTDQIQFNEKTLWEGGNTNSGSQGYYQNFGSILVKDLGSNFSIANSSKPVSNYVRYLDIMDGVAGVNFSSSTGSNYTRRYFTAMGQDDKVFVARYDVDGSDKLNLLFSYAPDGQINASGVTYSYDNGVAEASFHGKLTTVQYNTRFRVLTDGTLSRTDNGIKVANGTYATLLMAAATDFDITTTTATSGESEQELASRVQSRVASAAGKSYDALLSAHTAKQYEYMGRVDFHVGGASTMTTDDLVDFYNVNANNKGTADGLFLEQLYFQYGRYMTVAANADTSIPAPSNLQGIWNDRSNSSFWHCDLHADINVEMNYWPADPTNLSEMHLPFLNHIINLSTSKAWTDYAKKVSGNSSVPGWSVACESNIFGGTSQFSNGNMKTLGAWYCTHLWRYYQYTLDKEFLKKALPVMYNAALYIKSIAQQDIADRGSLYVIKGEYSPEHEGGNLITAFAQQTSSELFDEIIKAHAELGSASPLSNAQVQEISDFYANFNKGVQIETYSFNRNNVQYTNVPCIAEWMDKSLSDPGHRHLSHLMCVYPFSQITAYGTTQQEQDLFTAAGNAILARTGDVTGWSMGWQTNVYARVLKGNEARSYLSQALKHSTAYNIQMSGHGGCYYNLFDSHSPFQIDGNYGCTSGVAEMLLQSYDGTIHLLPALPDAWANGHINGLKAIGNFQVDQKWANKQLTKATIVNKHTAAQDLYVQYGTEDLTAVKVTVNGVETAPVPVAGKGYKLAAVAPGAKVVINISGEEEPEEEAVEAEYTLNPEEGDVEQSDLREIAITFDDEGQAPMTGEILDQEVILPTLSNGNITITAQSVGTRDEVYNVDYITFSQEDIAKLTDGTWTLTIPQGTFYVMGKYDIETDEVELIPIKAITATYNVVSGEVIATLTINGEEIDYHKSDAEIVLNDSQSGLTKVVIPNDVDDVDVTYTREFKNTNSQPWYVPFDITVPDGFTFYNIWTLKVDENTGVATAVVSKELSSGETIMANTPYIVKANKAGTYNFKSDALKATVEGEANDETWCATTELIYHFYGSYTSFDLSSKPCYYMSAGTFYYATTTTTLRPYRFYLVVGDKETNTPISPADLENAGAGSKLQIIILGDEENLPTGIGTVIAPSKNDIHFDLMGRKVNGNVSGLQILNGEKILVK